MQIHNQLTRFYILFLRNRLGLTIFLAAPILDIAKHKIQKLNFELHI
jgi:hypothetical protein